jgi:hypothetical protein
MEEAVSWNTYDDAGSRRLVRIVQLVLGSDVAASSQ